MKRKVIDNPHSGLKITVKVDDPLIFDEMLRDMASAMLDYFTQHGGGADIRELYAFAISTALQSAKKRGCTKDDWYKFSGYAGLLAAQAISMQLWEVNQ